MNNAMFTLHGNGVGHGIAIGKARLLTHALMPVEKSSIAPSEVSDELLRLKRAIDGVQNEFRSVSDHLTPGQANDSKQLLHLHLEMLSDDMLFKHAELTIETQQVNAEWALEEQKLYWQQSFSNLKDHYIGDKYHDVRQVIEYVQRFLMSPDVEIADILSKAEDDEIIIAEDLTPADTLSLRGQEIMAFLTDLGGPVSHTAILARSMNIPAVVGLHNATHYIRTGDPLVVDGRRGVVVVNPDQGTIAAYQLRREKILRRNQSVALLDQAHCHSLDDITVKLGANIELHDDIDMALKRNVDNIGLFRTEFLFMDSVELPSEQAQYEYYAEIIRQSKLPVTFRTLDLGHDKQLKHQKIHLGSSTSPLGLRALRVCLHDTELFKTQLRAIFRASMDGDIRLMLPMLTSFNELVQVKDILEEVKASLEKQHIAFKPNIPVGVMVEVPSIAITAHLVAKEVDFMSIGTNDLMQYTLAIDRGDDEVSYLYDPLHPAIIRLIKEVVDAGIQENIPVSMCGEMAGDSRYTRLLLALGLREFSMDASAIPAVKQMIRMSHITSLSRSFSELMSLTSPNDIHTFIDRHNKV